MNNKKRQSDTFDEALENLKSKEIADIFLEDWNNTISKDFTKLVKENMRGKMEQKMFFWLFKKTKSVYKNYWLECFKFYTHPQINKFPTLAVQFVFGYR